MLSFKPIELSDRDVMLGYIYNRSRLCDHSFTNLFVWRHKYRTAVCEYRGNLFIREFIGGDYSYMFPFGGDLDLAVKCLDEHCQGETYRMHLLSEEMARAIGAVRPGGFIIEERRNFADYIYNVRDLVELSGKKYHSKRNFIARFMDNYGDCFRYEDITPENMDDVNAFEMVWCRKNGGCSETALIQESVAIGNMLDNFKALKAKGGLLRVDGTVAAVTAGAEISSDTFGISIEKADYDIVGSYQMINREFAARNLSGYLYVNREDDMGLEGLRRAKMSYHPVKLEMKYKAVRKMCG